MSWEVVPPRAAEYTVAGIPIDTTVLESLPLSEEEEMRKARNKAEKAAQEKAVAEMKDVLEMLKMDVECSLAGLKEMKNIKIDSVTADNLMVEYKELLQKSTESLRKEVEKMRAENKTLKKMPDIPLQFVQNGLFLARTNSDYFLVLKPVEITYTHFKLENEVMARKVDKEIKKEGYLGIAFDFGLNPLHAVFLKKSDLTPYHTFHVSSSICLGNYGDQFHKECKFDFVSITKTLDNIKEMLSLVHTAGGFPTSDNWDKEDHALIKYIRKVASEQRKESSRCVSCGDSFDDKDRSNVDEDFCQECFCDDCEHPRGDCAC